MNLNESVSFSYTGAVQSFTVPNTGVYKFECYGAGTCASMGSSIGGPVYSKGGLAVGYKFLIKGTTLYICVGGAGIAINYPGASQFSYGYNGGGKGDGGNDGNTVVVLCSYGGGATHIATTNRGILSAYSGNKSEVLIVAGGAGGCANGQGGGVNRTVAGGSGGSGGGSGTFGQGSGTTSKTTTSGGLDWLSNYGPGGGGGWDGGSMTTSYHGNIQDCSSRGGTSYIDNCPQFTYMGTTYSPSTTAGAGTNGANGSAKITLVKKHPERRRIIAS